MTTKSYTLTDVANLVAERFHDGASTPRSDEYQIGFNSALLGSLCAQRTVHPYKSGTTEADAYFAGYSEGKAKARQLDDSEAK